MTERNAEDEMKTDILQRSNALIYCPICTHTVQAEAGFMGKKPLVTPGQKCPRCASALDAGLVIQFREAA
jgi:hypothetical protein